MNPEEPEGRVREPYEKPALRIIEMVAEEVMGVGCKSEVASGPLSGTSCTDTNCSTFSAS